MPITKGSSVQYIRVDTESMYAWDATLKEIRAGILRHVDGCTAENVSIVTEIKWVCSFCGAKWTEEDEDYNGGCCDKDEQNVPTFTRI